MTPIVTRPHGTNFVRWAEDKPEVLVLSADLTSSCEMNVFRDRYPERFVTLGMAEANLVGFAAGLAREGFSPWIHTFAVFLTRRVFDQVAMSVAYGNVPVRLVGFLPGVTTPGGATHQAIDDVALMRVLPNMTIFECGDATDVETVLDEAQAVPGPVYVRMLRGEVPRLFAPDEPFRRGHARVLSQGGDVTLLTTGICTEEALRLTALLRERGVAVQHLHVSTLKPFDDPAVDEALDRARHGVVTLENHSVIGGLGSAVAERMAERGAGKRLVRLGLQDTYAHGASRPYLLKKYGLDATALLGAVESLLGRSLGIDAAELGAVRLEPVHSAARAEAL